MSRAGMSGVEAVLLDAGGVLMLPDPSALRTRLGPFGVMPDDASCQRAAYLAVAEIDRLGRTDYEAANRFMAKALGVPERHLEAATEAINLVYTEDRGTAIDGVAAELLRLRAAGFRLGVVSNASGQVEAELLTHRICSRDGKDCAEVEFVIDSEIVGVEKPDPAIFDLALDALRLPAERCIYLGDSAYFDIGGAQAAGIKAIHLAPFGECAASDHADVRTLRDFVDDLLMTDQA